MMMIFWDKQWCSAHRVSATINGRCDASIIERLRFIIVEKERSKVLGRVTNAPIDIFTVLGFIELNDCAYCTN